MQALRGLSKDNTIRLVEIEGYIKTGKRPDGLQVTDAWVDESMKFLVEEMRPTLTAWNEVADEHGLEIDIVIAAGKLYGMWRKGVRGAALNGLFMRLGKALSREQRARLARNVVT